MKKDDSNLDWEKDAPTLAAMQRVNAFSVPQGYFESLSQNIQTNIILESHRFENEEEFTIPQGYFENLEQEIETKIILEGIKETNPTLKHSLPNNYFSNLSSKIESKIQEHGKSKKKNVILSWVRYSAVACLAMAIGSIIYINTQKEAIIEELSQVSDQEIINYLHIHSTVSDQQIIIENLSEDGLQQVSNDVSAQEIEQYINNNTL